MKIFHCNHCQHPVFFESFQCVNCGRSLAYLPDLRMIGSLEPAGTPAPDGSGLRKSTVAGALGRVYRRCSNYDPENVCNWAVTEEDPNPLCLSCRLTKVIPDLSLPGNKEAWYRMETAAACGLSLKPPRSDEPSMKAETLVDSGGSFERMIAGWFPLTYVLNNLNRSLGLADGYPFVLSAAAAEKLRFVHGTMERRPVSERGDSA